MRTLIPALALAIAAPLGAQQPQGSTGPGPSEQFIQQFDADKDGKVSEQEFLKPAQGQFRHMDKSGDGYITPDEAQAFQQEMQQRMEQMRQQRGQQGRPPGGQYPQQR